VTEALSEIAALRRTQETEAEGLKKNKATRVSMLNRIRKDNAEHKQAITDLEKSQERLRDLIGELERKRWAGKNRRGFRRRFRLAQRQALAAGRRQIIGTFGQSRHPRFGTVTFNNGIDIQAGPGPHPVGRRGESGVRGLDRRVRQLHHSHHGGGYYTLYAHASEVLVRPMKKYPRTPVIAEVGDSGSLNGYACHFEVRKSKQALNPMEWFAK